MFSPSKYRNLIKTINDLITFTTEVRSDYNANVTLANELKTDYNAAVTLINELKTNFNAAVTLINELKTNYATILTLANEIKADYNLLRGHALNMALGAAGLAEGTNANTLKTANAIDFSIGGRLYTKAITDNIAMTAAAAQAAETYCMYLVSINASGTVTITKGADVATDTAVLPAVPVNEAAIGAFKILTAVATTFTSGTDDLSAAGITATYYDLNYANTGASAPTAVAAADLAAIVTGNSTAAATADAGSIAATSASTTVATVPASIVE